MTALTTPRSAPASPTPCKSPSSQSKLLSSVRLVSSSLSLSSIASSGGLPTGLILYFQHPFYFGGHPHSPHSMSLMSFSGIHELCLLSYTSHLTNAIPFLLFRIFSTLYVFSFLSTEDSSSS